MKTLNNGKTNDPKRTPQKHHMDKPNCLRRSCKLKRLKSPSCSEVKYKGKQKSHQKIEKCLQKDSYEYGITNSKEYFDNLLDSTSESSESSIDEDIAQQFDKMVDDAIETGSDEEDIKRINKWVQQTHFRKNREQTVTKPKPSWYHMPDVSTPGLIPTTIKTKTEIEDFVKQAKKRHTS